MIDSLFVYHHMGLGDHIICNGMVRYIVEKVKPTFLYLPVKNHYYESVRSMYLDDHRIVCLPVDSDNDVPYLINFYGKNGFIKSGFEKTRKDWDVSFYDSVGIPFSARWDHFNINRNTEREMLLRDMLIIKEPYIVVHDTSVGGGKFEKMNVDSNGMRVIKIHPHTTNMFDWCSVIETAEEFHGIDSSAVHLAQSLDVKKGFIHCSTPTPPQKINNERWSFRYYDLGSVRGAV